MRVQSTFGKFHEFQLFGNVFILRTNNNPFVKHAMVLCKFVFMFYLHQIVLYLYTEVLTFLYTTRKMFLMINYSTHTILDIEETRFTIWVSFIDWHSVRGHTLYSLEGSTPMSSAALYIALPYYLKDIDKTSLFKNNLKALLNVKCPFSTNEFLK